MIQSAIVKLLKTVNSRVFANRAPAKSTLPCMVVDLESEFRNRHWQNGQTATGIVETDFEVSIWSTRIDDAYDLADSVISLLENYSGPLLGGDSPATEYRVIDIDLSSKSNGFDEQTKLYDCSLFFTIKHTTG